MTDIQIIQGIKANSEIAFQYAINKYSKLIWHIVSIALKNVASIQDIEECVADVFVYLWQNTDKFDEYRGNMKSWLVTAAKGKSVDCFRKLSKSRETELNDEIVISSFDVVDEIISNETKREILCAINTLTEIDREIVIRKFYYQQKPKEIGFVLDMSAKQVKNRLYQARLKLHTSLN